MKVAVATQQGGLNDQVSSVVGRAPTFTIVHTSNGEITDSKVLDNQFAQAQSGAGIQAAQMLANEQVQAIIGGNFGPNLANVFTQNGIKMYQAGGLSVRKAVNQLLQGQLAEASGATGPPGQGRGQQGGGRQPGGGRGQSGSQGQGGGQGGQQGGRQR